MGVVMVPLAGRDLGSFCHDDDVCCVQPGAYGNYCVCVVCRGVHATINGVSWCVFKHQSVPFAAIKIAHGMEASTLLTKALFSAIAQHSGCLEMLGTYTVSLKVGLAACEVLSTSLNLCGMIMHVRDCQQTRVQLSRVQLCDPLASRRYLTNKGCEITASLAWSSRQTIDKCWDRLSSCTSWLCSRIRWAFIYRNITNNMDFFIHCVCCVAEQ